MKRLVSLTLIAIILLIGIFSSVKANQEFEEQNRNSKFPRTKSGKTIRGPLGRKIDGYLRRTVSFGFSGAILIAKNGEIVLQNGYGYADRERRTPITPDTVFYIGSITKQFTAAAILKLEMAGKLRVTDTLDKFFKDVPADKKSITIHQLLTHSSGFGDTEDKYGDAVQKDAQLRRTIELKLNFEPGKEYLYSNAGYSLLGIIVENVSGEPYEKYVNENIFKPAGMFTTGYRIPKWDERKIARGYSEGADKGSPLERPWMVDGPSWALRGAGGMLSTLGDLYRWHLALEKDELLSAEAKRKIFSPHVKMNNHEFYGYGWTVGKTSRGTNLIKHDGGDGIFFADFHRYVDENVVLIGLTNDVYGAETISGRVPEIVFGNHKIKFPPLAGTKAISPAILQKYAGIYQLPSGATIAVTRRENRLILDPVGQEAVNLLAGVQPQQAKLYEKFTLKAQAILDAAAKGDFTLLKSNIAAQRFEGYKKSLAKFFDPSENKNFLSSEYKIIGTYPLWFNDGQPLTTFVRITGKNESPMLIMTWENNQLRGRGTVEEKDDTTFRTPFVARSTHNFVGFHNGLEKVIDIEFRVNRKGESTGIEFQTPQKIVTAKRVSSP